MFLVLLLCALPALAGAAGFDASLLNRAEQQLRAGDKTSAVATLELASASAGNAAEEDRLGYLYAVAGQPAEAVAHLKKSIGRDPGFALAHYHLGALLWLAKDRDTALPELEQAARLSPKTFDFRYRLGAAYLELGRDELAEDELKAALAITEPAAGRGDAWKQLGTAQQHRNDLAQAVQSYGKSLELDPSNDVTRNAYAALLIETRQPERGIQEAGKVLAHNQQDTSAQMNIGYAHLKMGDFAKAEQSYRRVVELEPQSAAAHYDLAIALKMQDRLESAQKEFARSIELDPSLAEAHYTLGITNWQLGDFPGTIEQMKAALAIRPEYAEAHYMLGIALKQIGDLDAALEELKASIKLDPSTPGPFNTMGQILRIKGDKQGSEQAFAQGAKLKRDKESQLANTLDQGMRGGDAPKPLSPK